MTLNKILRGIAITGVFGVFIVPFLVPSDMFFPFITGKGFFFRVVVEIIFAAWLLLVLRDPAARPRKSVLLWSFLAFVVIMAAADIFGVDAWKSFWSNFERMEGYITTIHLFMYFLVASTVLATENLWKRFLEWSLWSSLLMAFYGFFQLGGKIAINQGGVRVDGTFGNATYLAIYMLFNIFFALILIARDRQEPNSQDRHLWKPITYGIIAFLDLIILYYTATRGTILGLIGGLLLAALIVLIFDRRERVLRIIAGSIVGAVVVLVVGFIAIKNTSFVQHSPVLSRFASISLSDAESQARTYIWPMAIHGWEQRPILGWGQENFNYIFNANYDPRMWSQEQWFDHAHNDVLDWLVSGGILGLLAYLSLFVATLWLLWKRSGLSFLEKSLFTGLLAGYFFHNLFVFDNIMSYILFMSVMAMTQWKSTRLEKPITVKSRGKSGDKDDDDIDIRVVGAMVFLALCFAIYFFNWRGYETNLALIRALQAANSQPVNAQAALDNFQQALSYDTLGRPEVVERLVEAVGQMNSSAVPLDLRQKFAQMAADALNTQLTQFPGDARYELFAGEFFGMYGQNTLAEEHLLKAVALSPKKQSLIIQLGQFYVGTRQYDKALAAFKQAYDLDHNDTDAAKYYALGLVYMGRDSEAATFLAQTGAGTLNDDLFVQAYSNLGQWSKVISILKARIATNPGDMQSRQNLAGAYYQSGDRAGAIQAIRDAEAYDPSIKASGDALIQQIQAGK